MKASLVNLGRALHVIGWSGLCCVFLAISGPKIWPGLTTRSDVPAGPYFSSDSYLQMMTGARDVSARILEALAPLPRDKTVVLILPDASVRSALIAQNVTYLSWPREIRWLSAEDKNVEQTLFSIAPATLAALVFWDVAPFHGLPAGTRVGPRQIIIPLRPTNPPQV